MPSEHPWEDSGARVAMYAEQPQRFVEQHLSPLLIRDSDSETFRSDGDFWRSGAANGRLYVAHLERFSITNWFPRAPGVYWSPDAEMARKYVYAHGQEQHPRLGAFYKPQDKMGLIENGGIGSIRLRPRKVDGEYCWLGTAVSGILCHAGIPIAIPETLLIKAGIEWGDFVNLSGRVRYLQDAGLDDVASSVHHAQPLILFVDHLEGVRNYGYRKPLTISPTVLFQIADDREKTRYWKEKTQYTFAQCDASDEGEIRRAAEWMEEYSSLHLGEVITNFDQQRLTLAGAPLSYQRLVAKTYDIQVVNQYGGTLIAERIETMTYLDQSTTHNYGGIHVGDNITAGNNAIINNRSVLKGVTQSIGASNDLTKDQKANLDLLLSRLSAELDAIKANHPAETEEISEAVEKAVAVAVKPEKKKAFLDLKASNLIDAAKLAAEFAPSVMHAAGQLATYIQGLV
jgi:hypothetical protein